MIDVFRIGVNIAMSSNGPQVLGVLLGDLGKLHALAGAVNTRFAAMKTLAVGALGVMAGGAALHGLWDMVKASEELNKQLERAKLTGASAADIALMRKTAFDTNISVPTSTPSGNVKMMTELRSQLNSTQEAAELLPYFAKLAYILQFYTGKDSEGAAQTALKVADLRGNIFSRGPNGEERIDPAKLRVETDAMTRGIIASGGLLGPADYLNFAKQSGLAGKQMDPSVFYGMATEAMIAMGSSRAGTATGSLYQQIIGGTMTERVAEEMKKHGLLADYRVGRGGTIPPGSAGVVGKDEFQSDPMRWINDVVVGRLQAEGMNPRQILEEVAHLFGRQTVQRLVGEVIANAPQFQRTFGLFQQAVGAEEGNKEVMDKALQANLDSLHAAWTGFMEALGEPGIPLAIDVLKGLTGIVHAMTEAASAHPETVSWILGLTAAFSALVAIGGGYLVISTALGPIAAGLRGLGLAITGIGIGTFVAATAEIGALVAALTKLPPALHAIMDWINDVLGIHPPQPGSAARGGNQGFRGPEWSSPGHGRGFDPDYAPDTGNNGHNLTTHPGTGRGHGGARPISYDGDRTIILMMDGRAVARSISAAQARQMSLPPGSTSFDPRMTLLTPATAVQL